MSIITIINSDNMVIVDGEAISFSFTLDTNIWAIQWNGTSGHIEYADETANVGISSIAPYQSIIDGHTTEKARLLSEEVAAAATLASLQDFDSVQSSNTYTPIQTIALFASVAILKISSVGSNQVSPIFTL